MIFENENADYAYAVGRIRALETRLLSRGIVDRMLEASDLDELYRILGDTAYGASLSEGAEYEKMLQSEEARTVDLFEELCLDPALSELARYSYDFHNAKVLMKVSVAKEDFGAALSECGNVGISLFRSAFEEEKFGVLPEVLQQTITRALESCYTKEDPRLIDLVTDQEMFKFYRKIVRGLGSEFLSQLFALVVDLTNIKTLARLRRLEEDRDTLRLAIFEGGVVESGRYAAMAEEPWESLPHRFYATPYFTIVEEGYRHLEREGSFLILEKRCNDYLLDWLRNTRYTALGVEPLVAYFLAKRNELNILRLLFVGKRHGIEINRIKERLPDVF
ncbi:hypothetical protein AMJ40_04525 [candidate division TA06 bacterium DG_26]|uniref:V-type ATP synthase subunit C n=1 Tax=candidate division TA06 bacterium DG_26 TaxID=1703771 RepID=A0A0S7WI94_UNCT6|nr:MAG: hypothetical protein AMJ40_04525 [candidate division TA06 bacterium DG_26]